MGLFRSRGLSGSIRPRRRSVGIDPPVDHAELGSRLKITVSMGQRRVRLGGREEDYSGR